MSVNKVILIGNLGNDVQMHQFENGGCIGKFPLATSESYTSKQTGEKVTNTEWHSVVTRNKVAEICEKYLSKGDKVYVEGKIKTRKWQDDNGNDRYSTEIEAREITFLSTKVNNSKESQPIGQVSQTDEDDLPF